MITPLGRRAVLKGFRIDERWDARYINAIDGKQAEHTILDPKTMKMAE